jgi:hypothetical protein
MLLLADDDDDDVALIAYNLKIVYLVLLDCLLGFSCWICFNKFFFDAFTIS